MKLSLSLSHHHFEHPICGCSVARFCWQNERQTRLW
jgi:hypothetical protein